MEQCLSRPKCAFFLAVVATGARFPVGSFGLLPLHVSVLCPDLGVFSTPLPWTSAPGRGPPFSQLRDSAHPENPQMCTLVPFPKVRSMDPCLLHVLTRPLRGLNPNSGCQSPHLSKLAHLRHLRPGQPDPSQGNLHREVSRDGGPLKSPRCMYVLSFNPRRWSLFPHFTDGHQLLPSAPREALCWASHCRQTTCLPCGAPCLEGETDN